MMKTIKLSLILIAQIAVWQGLVAVAKKPLTFLVFMAADNNLSDFIGDDLSEMEAIGSNENVNILVHLNTTLPSLGKISRKLVVQKGHSDAWGADKSYDSGDATTVFRACRWAHKHFPADHFVLVFWNHGSGSINRSVWIDDQEIRSVCYDDTTGHYLTDADVRAVLDATVRNLRGGKKIDIVGFDACYMGGIETAYAVKDFAEYMVASEETILGTGYGYDRFLETAARGYVDPRLLAYAMVDAFNDEYVDITKDYTFSAIDLALLDPVVQKVNRTADRFIAMLRSNNGRSVQSVLLDCAQKSQHFSQATYIDLVDFLNNVHKSVKYFGLTAADAKLLSAEVMDTIDAIKRAVLADVHGQGYPRAHGISVYFSNRGIDKDYRSMFWTQNTRWADFLTLMGK